MRLLVSSAEGANGAGYGAILAFDVAGNALGTFCDDSRVADPRGLCVDPSGALLYVNNGNDRVLALDHTGQVLKDTGPIDALDPAEKSSDPMGAITWAPAASAQSWLCRPASTDSPLRTLPQRSSHSRGGLPSLPMVASSWRRV